MWHGESGLRRIRLSLQQWSSARHTAWADVAPQGTAGSVRGPPRLRTKRCQRPARGGQGGHARPWSARGSPHAPLPRPHTTNDAPAPNVNTPRSRSSGLLGSHSPREIPTPPLYSVPQGAGLCRRTPTPPFGFTCEHVPEKNLPLEFLRNRVPNITSFRCQSQPGS